MRAQSAQEHLDSEQRKDNDKEEAQLVGGKPHQEARSEERPNH